jgi:hypothetical protein
MKRYNVGERKEQGDKEKRKEGIMERKMEREGTIGK